ncbi:UNKNOWN [Stylonychia lemnae]|uniref:Uncharacterized protein n=1 Tax=Stylonychia lemnae TaxID=5949 RepID=A0A078B682_STYLE|nr:UNKNOWN [Stylonychia lemnae]|eukprot:CDW90030.1 UNKNOWN [Stylonychia lemnae]
MSIIFVNSSSGVVSQYISINPDHGYFKLGIVKYSETIIFAQFQHSDLNKYFYQKLQLNKQSFKFETQWVRDFKLPSNSQFQSNFELFSLQTSRGTFIEKNRKFIMCFSQSTSSQANLAITNDIFTKVAAFLIDDILSSYWSNIEIEFSIDYNNLDQQKLKAHLYYMKNYLNSMEIDFKTLGARFNIRFTHLYLINMAQVNAFPVLKLMDLDNQNKLEEKHDHDNQCLNNLPPSYKVSDIYFDSYKDGTQMIYTLPKSPYEIYQNQNQQFDKNQALFSVAAITKNILTIYSADISTAGDYLLQLNALINNDIVGTIPIYLKITGDKQDSLNNQKFANEELRNCNQDDLVAYTEKTTIFKISQCLQMIRAKGYIININTKTIKEFSKNILNGFQLNPHSKDIGIYKVKIQIRDSQFKSLKVYYDFKVFVQKSLDGILKCSEQDQRFCNPRIARVSVEGIVVLKFPKAIVPIDRQFYDNASNGLQITLINQEYSNATLLKYSIIDSTKNQILIQLVFQNPIDVSQSILVNQYNVNLFQGKDQL